MIENEDLAVAMQREARKLMFSAALDATKMKKRIRLACRAVILGGQRQADVCRKTGLDRRDLSAAVVRVRAKLAEVESYVQEQVERP